MKRDDLDQEMTLFFFENEQNKFQKETISDNNCRLCRFVFENEHFGNQKNMLNVKTPYSHNIYLGCLFTAEIIFDVFCKLLRN